MSLNSKGGDHSVVRQRRLQVISGQTTMCDQPHWLEVCSSEISLFMFGCLSENVSVHLYVDAHCAL